MQHAACWIYLLETEDKRCCCMLLLSPHDAAAPIVRPNVSRLVLPRLVSSCHLVLSCLISSRLVSCRLPSGQVGFEFRNDEGVLLRFRVADPAAPRGGGGGLELSAQTWADDLNTLGRRARRYLTLEQRQMEEDREVRKSNGLCFGPTFV
jgi:hypothetical protein